MSVRTIVLGTALCAALAMVWPMQARAETHALLIGVTEIAALPKRLWLRGPDNDVTLMRDTLVARGVSADRIVLLASARVPGASVPTRQAIVSAMQAMIGRAQRGDTVVLLLAGHGTQVPQPGGARYPEPDGLDELFLTADVQAWDPRRGVLPNAVVDDEIGDWIDALVDRGATVWAIFDTCHAGGMARGAAPSQRVRSVAGAELGVPVAAPGSAGVRSPKTHGNVVQPRTDGRVLAYAARAHEGTVEEWLPKGSPRARVQGIFTYALAEAVRRGASDAHAVGRGVIEAYRHAGRTAPVPLVLGGGSLIP